MGPDHIRFVLMVAFFFFFSTCLISCSAPHGSEMEITRFSGAYTLTHSEKAEEVAVDVTESVRRSTASVSEEEIKKVTKVGSSSQSSSASSSSSLPPTKKRVEEEEHERSVSNPISRSKKTNGTDKEYKMRREKSGSSKIQNGKEESFAGLREKGGEISRATSETTQGTSMTSPDQGNFVCWSQQAQKTGQSCCNSNHERTSKKFTAVASYFVSGSGSRNFPSVCQKVSFSSFLLNGSRWTVKDGKGDGRKKGRSNEDVIERHQDDVDGDHHAQEELELKHEQDIHFENDHPSTKPIFFVYPQPPLLPRLPRSSHFPKKITEKGKTEDEMKVEKDDGIDYYEPTFHLLDFSNSIEENDGSSSGWLLEYDPRIIGGFDSYGQDVSFYFDRKNDAIIVNNKKGEKVWKGRRKKQENSSRWEKDKEGSNSLANSSSYDELCKALLLDCG